ncbi:MAG: hypothetical protein IPO93_00420 [Actinobacteria bacterium]|nr:hypothetical protein [Actinomycetota bacterium]
MVVAEIRVLNASKADFDAFDVGVSGAIEEMGGPPEGLVTHVVRPDGDGFVICDVWRTPEDLRRFNDGVLLPMLAAAGHVVSDERVSPVWSYARP